MDSSLRVSIPNTLFCLCHMLSSAPKLLASPVCTTCSLQHRCTMTGSRAHPLSHPKTTTPLYPKGHTDAPMKNNTRQPGKKFERRTPQFKQFVCRKQVEGYS